MDNLFSPFWFSSLMVKMRGGKGLTHQQNNHSVRFRKARYECIQCRIRRDLFFTGSLTPFVVHFAGQDPPQEMLIITWDSQQGQWYPHLTELLPHHAHVINIHRVPKKMYPRCYLKMCINFFGPPRYVESIN